MLDLKKLEEKLDLALDSETEESLNLYIDSFSNEKEEGLQSKVWDGYFNEEKDSIMGYWKRCMICNKIPSEIYYTSSKFFTISHCKKCKEQDYKPKNWWQKFWIFIDKKQK